jgi:DNA-binding response OmpR family regulator
MRRQNRDVLNAPVKRPQKKQMSRILVVGGDPEQRARLAATLKDRGHRCTHVHRLDEGRLAVEQHAFDLIVLNPSLPDGDGLELARTVQQASPATKVIIYSETGSFMTALEALRCGAVDFINTPDDSDDLVERVEAALAKSITEQERAKRMHRLQRICRELNTARTEIAGQVDQLCGDIVAAYRDFSEQISDVKTTTELRTLLRQELDVEEALRTMLEFMLSRLGPTNAAVFLPDSAGRYSLGAYVNYDCPRDAVDELLHQLCETICPQMIEERDIVAFDDAQEFAQWIGMEDNFLAETQVIAMSCPHDDECLAVIVLFRPKSAPFEPQAARTLDIIRNIFAEQLAQVVRIHHRAAPSWPEDMHADDQFDDDDFEDDDFDLPFEGGMAA